MANLTAINQSVGSQSTTSGQNLKTIHAMLLQRLAPAFTGFTDQEKGILSNIANQCVGQGGEGVYMARSLLSETTGDGDFEYDYDDECIQAQGQEQLTVPSSTQEGYSIYPNPAVSQVELTMPDKHGVGKIILSDLHGRTLSVQVVEPRQTKVLLEVSGLAAGVYLIAGEKNEFTPLRFVVTK